MTKTAEVEVKSAWTSKINWTQVVAVLAMILTVFGFSLPPELQAQIVAGIVAVQALVTWVLKTFFTTSVTTASAKNL